MITLTAAEVDVLSSGQQKLGIFFRMALNTGSVIRLWLGTGYIRAGISALDAANETYSGLGQLIDVPAVQQLINGVADRATFRVSGVSEDTLAVASGESNDVKGAACAVGVCVFGAAWRQLGVPIWLWRGRADFLTVNQESDDRASTRVIELSVGSLFTSRRRRTLSYLTDQDQQSRSPGDKFCERTVLLSEFEKVWPRYP